MDHENHQIKFFQKLKSTLPSHVSFVDLIAEILGIGIDSTYRRIRGVKPLEFEEIQKLCAKFNISFDQFIGLNANTFTFNGVLPEPGYRVTNWLESMLNFFEHINSFKKRHFYWFVRDFPVFILFQVPELLAFKCFFWSKSILEDPLFENVKFSVENSIVDARNIEIGNKISQIYSKIPTTEIWNIENISATLRQLEYYKQLNVFQSSKDLEILYDKLEQIVSHVEKQAEVGKKFLFGKEPDMNGVDYNLYMNTLILGDGISISEIDDAHVTWVIHGFINIITTMDLRFNQYTYAAMKNLIRKSNQISITGELNRKRFFDTMREKIQQSRKN